MVEETARAGKKLGRPNRPFALGASEIFSESLSGAKGRRGECSSSSVNIAKGLLNFFHKPEQFILPVGSNLLTG